MATSHSKKRRGRLKPIGIQSLGSRHKQPCISRENILVVSIFEKTGASKAITRVSVYPLSLTVLNCRKYPLNCASTWIRMKSVPRYVRRKRVYGIAWRMPRPSMSTLTTLGSQDHQNVWRLPIDLLVPYPPGSGGRSTASAPFVPRWCPHHLPTSRSASMRLPDTFRAPSLRGTAVVAPKWPQADKSDSSR